MIVFCEPQCYGFEHAAVNASLLNSAASAFPEEKFVLMAEKEHLNLIRASIEANNQNRVEFHEIVIASRRSSNIKRFFKEFGVYRNVLNSADKNGSKKIMFLSVSSPGLIWLKWMLLFHPRVRAVAVMHGILETIEDWSSILKYEIFFWFRFTLFIGNYDRINYLVFGSFIRSALDRRFPSLSRFTRSMDLPYRFCAVTEREPFQNGMIYFGALGVGSRSKGTDVYFEITKKVRLGDTLYRPEFCLVGPVTDHSLVIPPSVRILSQDGLPLTDEDYHDGSMKLDYAVFCHRPSHYRYSTSAAFFDALAFGKPVIALRNPLFEYYFELFGDIGYLCDSQEQMVEVMVSILRSPAKDLYRKQQAKILAGREKLNALHAAKQFKEIW